MIFNFFNKTKILGTGAGPKATCRVSNRVRCRPWAYKPRSLSYLSLSLSARLTGRRDGVVAEVGGRAGEARVDRRHRPAASQERW
jgi:hypothetical protein